MIPPGFIAGCYFDPISTERPNQFLPHMNMRQTPMAYSPQTNYLYAVACVNPAWMKRANTGWEFIQPTRLPGQKQYGVLAAIDARTAKIAWQKRLAYSECEGSGGALTTAGGLMFHSEPDGVFQAYDAKTGDELWRFQTGELGLGGGAGPSGAAAMTYESRGEQFVALANNRAVWAFKIGGTVPPRPAPMPPATTREWAGRIEDGGADPARNGEDIHHRLGEQEGRLGGRLRPEPFARSGEGGHARDVHEQLDHFTHDRGTRWLLEDEPDQTGRIRQSDGDPSRRLRVCLHRSSVDHRSAHR